MMTNVLISSKSNSSNMSSGLIRTWGPVSLLLPLSLHRSSHVSTRFEPSLCTCLQPVKPQQPFWDFQACPPRRKSRWFLEVTRNKHLENSPCQMIARMQSRFDITGQAQHCRGTKWTPPPCITQPNRLVTDIETIATKRSQQLEKQYNSLFLSSPWTRSFAQTSTLQRYSEDWICTIHPPNPWGMVNYNAIVKLTRHRERLREERKR